MLLPLLILSIIFGLIYWLIILLPIPASFKNVAIIILIVLAIILLFRALQAIPYGPIQSKY
jgi:hypothetical protein